MSTKLFGLSVTTSVVGAAAFCGWEVDYGVNAMVLALATTWGGAAAAGAITFYWWWKG